MLHRENQLPRLFLAAPLLSSLQFRCAPASRLSTETSKDQISGFEKLALMSED